MNKTELKAFVRASSILFLFGLIVGCTTPQAPLKPPVNYTGPITEGPILKQGYYWVYETVHGRRFTRGSGTVLGRPSFPLWVGKWWSFETGGYLEGRDPGETPHSIAMEMLCKVVGFEQMTVVAGTFNAFQCQCTCGVLFPGPSTDPYCGKTTYWYAPEVKNVIRMDTEDTDTSFELVEFKIPDNESR